MSEKLICEKCGSEMEGYIEGFTCGMICKNCGWCCVTTYYEPIRLDNTDYDLYIEPIENPSVDILRCIANLFDCNYLVAKRKLQNKIIFTEKAIAIRDIAVKLKKNGINFAITPDFSYEIQ